jgi:hypothetical protein
MMARRGHVRPLIAQALDPNGTMSPVCIRFAGSSPAAYPIRWAKPVLWILSLFSYLDGSR